MSEWMGARGDVLVDHFTGQQSLPLSGNNKKTPPDWLSHAGLGDALQRGRGRSSGVAAIAAAARQRSPEFVERGVHPHLQDTEQAAAISAADHQPVVYSTCSQTIASNPPEPRHSPTPPIQRTVMPCSFTAALSTSRCGRYSASISSTTSRKISLGREPLVLRSTAA